jgi:predicted DNA-binding protein with PD1-like motif
MKGSPIIFLVLIFFTGMAQKNELSSSAQFFTIRLKPHDDLKDELILFAKKHNLKAACIVTCVGSLEQFHLRYAHQDKGEIRKGHFEIVSLTGTFSDSSSHLHVALSDSLGVTTGGHVLEQNQVYTTVEIVVAEQTDLEFVREPDPTYGFNELTILPRKQKNKKP